ncbi:small nuclear ribonucleoprotein [Candidatus Woesearchaeota archaeon]|jgi:small nuclear ribonucleoprotein (snRNP)-like protein|nr:small nuclear ribonucleoprotein [Candidatus Woesearchaeota archaeon]MBT4387970.1 small nuclear ribonucleoprotein [Candidatus Woesearchaeota archaeon]MBT4595314.1 small nuclear ribonucleoprotein [Candidatus Woesearchaeota archaeon]MBT5741488.1 small nuclear ribonucleoprotein [Candidatus Woesearchaeota archaeon]MBT6505630.1 small nuclear ribonucleoprotein [Candidatus Woesearchaeota archaeon]
MEMTKPFDTLNASKGKRVVIELTKEKRRLIGTLKAFDQHINVVLEETEEYLDGELKSKLGSVFLRGAAILYISPAN